MKILVGVASKHGATKDIAARIAARLTAHGHVTELQALGTDNDVSDSDVFVLGSAVYMDTWRKDARAFVETHLDLLRDRPVWLFSSGPLSDDTGDGLPPNESNDSRRISVRSTTMCSPAGWTGRRWDPASVSWPQPFAHRQVTSAHGMRSTNGPTGSPNRWPLRR